MIETIPDAKTRPRQDSNLQSSDPKSDALSIRPRGQPRELLTKFVFYTFLNFTLDVEISPPVFCMTLSIFFQSAEFSTILKKVVKLNLRGIRKTLPEYEQKYW